MSDQKMKRPSAKGLAPWIRPVCFPGRYLIIARFAAPDAQGSGVRPEKETAVGQKPGVRDTPGVAP